jgi:hypothetical protein
MTTGIEELATEYVRAIGEKRLDLLAGLLHPDFEGRRPSGSVIDKDGYLDGSRRLALILLRTEIRRVFVEGDEVVVIYDMVTDTPAETVLTSEWLTVADGLVRSSALMLQDVLRWPEAMAEMGRRSAT